MKTKFWGFCLVALSMPVLLAAQTAVDSAFLAVHLSYDWFEDDPSDTLSASLYGPYHLVEHYAGTSFRLFQPHSQTYDLDLSVVGTFWPDHFDPDGFIDGQFSLNATGKSLQERNQLSMENLLVEIPLDHTFPKPILHQLVYWQIHFLDIDESPFYQQGAFDQMDTDYHTKVKENMLADIHYVADAMRGEMEEPRINGGRFKNQGLFDAMEASSLMDIESFLNFVLEFPGKYIGHRWKISETYATWLINDAPTIVYDLRDLLGLDPTNPDHFARYLNAESESDLFLYPIIWRGEADQRRDAEQVDKALLYYLVALGAAEYSSQPVQAAWIQFDIANLVKEQGELEKSIYWYQKAFETFEQHENKAGIISAGNNLASALLDAEAFEQARTLLENILEREVQWIGQESDYETRPTVALTYRFLGNAYKGLDKLKKAQKYYEEGLSFADGEQPLAYKRKALLLEELADLMRSQANEEQASWYTFQAGEAWKKYEQLQSEKG
ncbi:MAG: tetratricopeptide repeat protein [Bacteroidota bacterium]